MAGVEQHEILQHCSHQELWQHCSSLQLCNQQLRAHNHLLQTQLQHTSAPQHTSAHASQLQLAHGIELAEMRRELAAAEQRAVAGGADQGKVVHQGEVVHVLNQARDQVEQLETKVAKLSV